MKVAVAPDAPVKIVQLRLEKGRIQGRRPGVVRLAVRTVIGLLGDLLASPDTPAPPSVATSIKVMSFVPADG